jgi:Holliday junction DNA helicase RuvB
VFIAAARARGEALDHVLFIGPPGLGKTTLAQIVAREMGVGFRATSGPVIARRRPRRAAHQPAAARRAVHRRDPPPAARRSRRSSIPAMEDFQLDLIIGEGPAARSVRIDLPPFTLVGATTRSGLHHTPLRERFGIPLRLDFYDPSELERSSRAAPRARHRR